ncbi:MAG: T9SS type A sorting domain-containing protein, partial [Melioribacteraceae bacterium]
RSTLNIGAGRTPELSLPPLDCTIVNNIFYSTYSPLVTFTDNPINLSWRGNIFYGTSIGMILPTNNYNDDPKLFKSSDNLYRLSSNSPAINRSDINYTVIKDMDGQIRNGIIDAGADEYSQDPILIRPLTKNDVGPIWMQTPTNVESEINQIPTEFSIEQNYPNPFNPSTVISYRLPVDCFVSLKVYDLLGREVATLVDEFKKAGIYHSTFSTLHSALASGLYIYRFEAGKFIQTKKMLLLK